MFIAVPFALIPTVRHRFMQIAAPVYICKCVRVQLILYYECIASRRNLLLNACRGRKVVWRICICLHLVAPPIELINEHVSWILMPVVHRQQRTHEISLSPISVNCLYGKLIFHSLLSTLNMSSPFSYERGRGLCVNIN